MGASSTTNAGVVFPGELFFALEEGGSRLESTSCSGLSSCCSPTCVLVLVLVLAGASTQALTLGLIIFGWQSDFVSEVLGAEKTVVVFFILACCDVVLDLAHSGNNSSGRASLLRLIPDSVTS